MLRAKLRAMFSLPIFLATFVAFWVFMTAGQKIADPDVWWHLRNAEYLFTHMSFPRVDLYSFTALGSPWINHEWMGEIPYYLAWRAWGLVGVWAVFVALLEVILMGNFYWAYKNTGNVKGSFLVAVYCALLAKVSFGPRTLLFGYAYLLILLLVLWRFRTRDEGPLWVLPLLFCAWINTHGSWLLGLIVFGIYGASGLLEGTWGRVEATRWSPAQLRSLIKVGVASVAALFVNPYGYRLVFYPFDLAFRQKLNVANVDEWASVNFHDLRGKLVFILLVALLVAALMTRSPLRLEEVGLTVFALYLGLTYIRFVFLAAILLAPILAKQLHFVPAYRPETDKPALNFLFMAVMVGVMIWRVPSSSRLEESVGEIFPIKGMMYVRTHKLSGRVFNDFTWGGYINWRDPETKVFIDSRTDIFEYRGVLKDYLDTISMTNPLGVFDKYEIRYVFFPTKSMVSYLLNHNSGWKVLFTDEVGTIFERAGSTPTQASAKPVAETGNSP